MELEVLSWPAGMAGKQVPVPKSTVGKLSYDRDDSFLVYVGDTSKEEYNVYLNICSEAGFNVDYDKSDNRYLAYNSEGWLLTLNYVGGSIMSVQVEAPVIENESTDDESEIETDNTDDQSHDGSTNEMTEEEWTTEEVTEPPTENTPEPTTEEEDSGLTLGKINALASAESYLWLLSFSYEGLIEQLEYEGFTREEAVYAADNCGANWNEEALESAESYLSYMAFSYSGLIDQLEYEKFTTAQATYAADNCGADWFEQAAKCAESYLEYMSFSRQGLIDQLLYEGFTYEQAVYGVEANGL